jgi:hypothetical protein
MPKPEFKPDPARERMLQWRTDDPERWAMLQPGMRAVLEEYERMKAVNSSADALAEAVTT